jgi:hypothetical protein
MGPVEVELEAQPTVNPEDWLGVIRALFGENQASGLTVG